MISGAIATSKQKEQRGGGLSPEEVEVAAEEDVQPHLDVVAALVHVAGHLAAQPLAALVNVDLVAL